MPRHLDRTIERLRHQKAAMPLGYCAEEGCLNPRTQGTRCSRHTVVEPDCIFVAQRYETSFHASFPISHHRTLEGAKQAVETACPAPIRWDGEYRNGAGQRVISATSVEEPKRDDRGYLPSILPEDFTILEVEVVE